MSNEHSGTRPILEEDLHAYVDGALDPARLTEVRAYLDRHPEAAAEVAGFAQDRQALRAALAPIAAEPVPPALNLARLIDAHERLADDERPSASRRWPWGMAAALLLAFGVGGGAGWSLGTGGASVRDAGIAALAREATSSYGVYASDRQRPVEMGAAQRAELVSWVSARLGRQIAIPDLSGAGYAFIGGRLVATEHGPAGLFMYDDAGGTRIALMVRPMAIDRDTPMMEHSEGPLSGYAWADQGLGYGVVGTYGAGVLHPLADEMRRQIGQGPRS